MTFFSRLNYSAFIPKHTKVYVPVVSIKLSNRKLLRLVVKLYNNSN